jgi:hypothetical protein
MHFDSKRCGMDEAAKIFLIHFLKKVKNGKRPGENKGGEELEGTA